jgi:ketosteroid isomerase-like protein
MSRDEMRRLVDRLHALWSNGDLSMIPSIYAPDFVAHMSATSGMGTLRGHDAVRDAIAGVRDAVSSFTETVADMIIDGDKVVTRYFVTGTHTKPFLGVAPTN